MDRDGDGEMEERRSIRDSSRKLKKYGSTSRHVTRNEHLVKHTVNKNDTLQGIALKYGVTTEQIRRINRLWASDSLFLREHLLVPVQAESTGSIGNVDSPFSSTDTCTALSSAFTTTPVTSPEFETVAGDGDDSSADDGTSVTDFLAKMDSSIASVKNQVKRVQGSSEFCCDGNDNDSVYYDRDSEGPTIRAPRRHKATARLRNSHPIAASSAAILHEASTSPEKSPRSHSASDASHHSQLPTAVVMTQGRRVKTSLQKLQQQQDEIFQL